MKKKARLIKKIITFIGSFVAALSVIAQFFPDAFSFMTEIPGINRIVILFVVVLLLGLFFLNWKQNQDDVDLKFQSEHDATHRYAHLLRDTTYEAIKLNAGQVNDPLAIHLLTSFTKNTVECISDSLYEFLGADPSKNELMVCVKVLDYEFWNNLSIKDKTSATYHTLSRSITPKGALQADDASSHSIKECTPFYRIFVDGKHDWFGYNLNSEDNIQIISEDEESQGMEFIETCPSWYEHFTNKIVVPIRVKLAEIDNRFLNTDERNLFGFLCVEFKNPKLIKVSDKSDEDLISMCDYLKTYADTMYVVFDSIYKGMSYYQIGDRK